jgi:hypothetical protein
MSDKFQSQIDQIITEQIDAYNKTLDDFIKLCEDPSIDPEVSAYILKCFTSASISIDSLEKTFNILNNLNQQLSELIKKLKQEI